MNDRLKELEERNERLFAMLGKLEAKIDLGKNETYTVEAVRKILMEIAYGKDEDE